MIALKTN